LNVWGGHSCPPLADQDAENQSSGSPALFAQWKMGKCGALSREGHGFSRAKKDVNKSLGLQPLTDNQLFCTGGPPYSRFLRKGGNQSILLRVRIEYGEPFRKVLQMSPTVTQYLLGVHLGLTKLP
jgi:hypothetical protein